MNLKNYIKEFLLVENANQTITICLYHDNQKHEFNDFNKVVEFVYNNLNDFDKIESLNQESKQREPLSKHKAFWDKKLKKFGEEIKSSNSGEKKSTVTNIWLYHEKKKIKFDNESEVIKFVYNNRTDFGAIKMYDYDEKKWSDLYKNKGKGWWSNKVINYIFNKAKFKSEIEKKIEVESDTRGYVSAFRNPAGLAEKNNYLGILVFKESDFNGVIKDKTGQINQAAFNSFILKKINEGRLIIIDSSGTAGLNSYISKEENVVIITFRDEVLFRDGDIKGAMIYMKFNDTGEEKYIISNGGEFRASLPKELE